MKRNLMSKSLEQHCTEAFFLFLFGGVLYYAMEIVYRGYSHWTMALCGAICFWGIYQINQRFASRSLSLRALMGAGMITLVELLIGCICNLWLHLQIWDYSNLPLHLLGQICIPFSLIWFLLSFPALWLCSLIQRKVFSQND